MKKVVIGIITGMFFQTMPCLQLLPEIKTLIINLTFLLHSISGCSSAIGEVINIQNQKNAIMFRIAGMLVNAGINIKNNELDSIKYASTVAGY